ncbi:MAG: hypothetical protein ACRC1M_03320 [Methanobacteriaceae archaeon]
MKKLTCENCGSKGFVEENGILTCKSCGTKYPDFSLNNVGIKEELKDNEIMRLFDANERDITFKFIRSIVIIPLLLFGYFIFAFILVVGLDTPAFYLTNLRSLEIYALYANSIGVFISSFISVIIIVGIFYLLYDRGFFHEGKSDLEPSLNILSDYEVLKYAPKSRAARKIRAKQRGSIFGRF